jgi:hypothetical protein
LFVMVARSAPFRRRSGIFDVSCRRRYQSADGSLQYLPCCMRFAPVLYPRHHGVGNRRVIGQIGGLRWKETVEPSKLQIRLRSLKRQSISA